VETELRTLLSELFNAFATAQGLPIDEANMAFDAPSMGNDKYIKLDVLPAGSTDSTTKGDVLGRQWLVRPSIYVRKDAGDGGASPYVDALRTEFPQGRRLASANYVFTVKSDVDNRPPISMDGWFLTPVEIRFQSSN